MAEGKHPEVTLIGWNIFGDHFSPVLLAFVPLYALAATPLWFFAAQAAAAGAAFLVLPRLLDALAVPAGRRWPILLAFAVAPLLWNPLLYDFHPPTLAIPFLLVAITASITGDMRRLVAASLLVVLLRDDLGILVTVVALAGVSAASLRSRILGPRLVLAAGGIGWVIAGSLIGSALNSDRHWDYRYGHLGASPVDAVTSPMESIPPAVDQLLSAHTVELFAIWLLGFGFLPLVRPKWLIGAAVVALPLVLSDDSNLHSVGFHYGAAALPFLVAAAGAGMARLPERFVRPHAVVAVPVLAVLAFAVVGPPATSVLTRDTIDPDDGRAAAAAIDDDDAVVAPAHFGPHVAHRDVLLPFPYPFLPADRNFPLDEEVIEVSARRRALIDVVVIAPSPFPGEEALSRDFLASRFAEDFCRERHGEVLLLRRC